MKSKNLKVLLTVFALLTAQACATSGTRNLASDPTPEYTTCSGTLTSSSPLDGIPNGKITLTVLRNNSVSSPIALSNDSGTFLALGTFNVSQHDGNNPISLSNANSTISGTLTGSTGTNSNSYNLVATQKDIHNSIAPISITGILDCK